MKRLFFRIGVLAITVVLGLIAYAYAQRGTVDRYSPDNTAADNASPLRGPDTQTTSPNYTVNPLRDNTLRAGPADDNSFDKKSIKDSRVKRVAADAPAADSAAHPGADPFGLTSHKGGLPGNQVVPQTLPDNTIPDAAALDPPPTGANADQSRYPQLVGPNLNSPSNAGPSFNRGNPEGNAGHSLSKQNPSYPPMVEQYPAGRSAADRSYAASGIADRYADAGNPPDGHSALGKPADRYGNRPAGTTPSSSNGREPAPFKADPSTAPRALAQTADKGRDRNSGLLTGNTGNSAAEGFANSDGTGQPGSKQLEGAQTPQVTIQKFAQNEIQVGKPAVFKIAVRNTGTIPAGQVEIRDQTPRGTKLSWAFLLHSGGRFS